MTDIQSKFKEAQASITSVETEARAIESELNTIPGVKGRLPNRQYGIAVNTAALAQNITVTALINRHRPDIAAYLGLQDGGISDEKKSVKHKSSVLNRCGCKRSSLPLVTQPLVSNGNNVHNSHRGNAVIRHEDQPDAPRL